MFDQILDTFATPVYLELLGERGRFELFASNGDTVPVDWAVIGDIEIAEELVTIGEEEQIRKLETREVDIRKGTYDDQLFAKAIIDGDKDRPWSVDRVSNSGVITTINLRRKRPARHRLRNKTR